MCVCVCNVLLSSSGQTVTGLVREFMEFFDLDFSCAVFDPETNVVSKCILQCIY